MSMQSEMEGQMTEGHDVIRRSDALDAVTQADKNCRGAHGARENIRALPAVPVQPYLTHATQDAAKDARIRELEKALLPFSEMAGELFAKNWNNDEIAMSVNRDGKCSKLLASAFFDARAVLQGEK